MDLLAPTVTDYFDDTVAILNYIVLIAIMGCPGNKIHVCINFPLENSTICFQTIEITMAAESSK